MKGRHSRGVLHDTGGGGGVEAQIRRVVVVHTASTAQQLINKLVADQQRQWCSPVSRAPPGGVFALRAPCTLLL